MAWFKVDDRFWSHPKTADLSDGATALWIRAGSWASGHLTDGVVPASMLRLFRARRRSADELVAVGLWSIAGDTFVFNSWDEYQPLKAQVEAKREATKTRVNAWRERVGNGVTGASQQEGRNAPPDPTRPDPTRPIKKATADTSKPFAEFWAVYPRKDDKRNAQAAFDRALKRATADAIIAGARAYAADPNREASFTKHPATWLNADAWANGPLPARGGGGPSKDDRFMATVEIGRRLQAQSGQKELT